MDQEELQKLIAEHYAEVLGFFRARTGDDAVAHDLTQKAFLEVARRAHTYDPAKGTFRTFVMIWARYVWLEWREQRGRSRLVFENDLEDPDEDGEGFYARTADSTDDVDLRLTRAQAYLELLRHSGRCDRPPHEVIEHCLNVLGYKPAEIVAELADVILFDLQNRIEVEYSEFAPLVNIHQELLPLRTRLRSKVGDVLDDPRTREIYEGLVDFARIAGETTFRAYFRSHEPPEPQVGRWSEAVKRAVVLSILRADRGLLREWAQQARAKRKGARAARSSAAR